MTLRLPRLEALTSYFDAEGRPTRQMIIFWQRTVEALEAQEARQDELLADLQAVQEAQAEAIAAIEAAQAAADAANAAAAAADAAAATAQAEADAAALAAAEANTAVTQIEAGTYELDAVTVGGTRFINVAGELVPE